MSSNGKTIAIGSPYYSSEMGKVCIYEYDNDIESWIQQGASVEGESIYDRSGTSVSLSGDGKLVAIGAPYNGNDSEGRVRVYERKNFLKLSEGNVEQLSKAIRKASKHLRIFGGSMNSSNAEEAAYSLDDIGIALLKLMDSL